VDAPSAVIVAIIVGGVGLAVVRTLAARQISLPRLVVGPGVLAAVAVYALVRSHPDQGAVLAFAGAALAGAALGWTQGARADLALTKGEEVVIRPSWVTGLVVLGLLAFRVAMLLTSGVLEGHTVAGPLAALSEVALSLGVFTLLGLRLELLRRALALRREGARSGPAHRADPG
jgi:hypothetical protein